MNRYQRLLGNTAIFAIGTFSSKILVFIMMRYYTAVLNSEQFGISDTITQTANVMIPFATVCITSAIIRFGLEKTNNKKEVFTIGVATVAVAYAVLLLFEPLLAKVKYLDEYTMLIYAYVLTSSLQQLSHQFVRARGHVRLYAIDGVFRTVMTIVCNVLYLSAFKMGIIGYVLGTMTADVISTICLFLIDEQYKFLDFRHLNRTLAGQMLKYSVLLIPAQVCNWIISMSDRYFLNYMHDAADTGLYSVANRIPTILILISSIFIEAWQISTINDSPRQEQERFFTRVGNVYQALVFLMVSGIILFAKLAVFLLAAPSYYTAWRIIPFLVIGSGFACLSNFMNSIYTLEKKSNWSMLTVLCGACTNLALNALMIPKMGPNGAALATMISYILMFLIRAVHTRQYIRVRWHVGRFAVSAVLLIAQGLLLLAEGPLWIPIQVFLFLLIALLNLRDILIGVRKVLHRA